MRSFSSDVARPKIKIVKNDKANDEVAMLESVLSTAKHPECYFPETVVKVENRL